jgi:hypothetical protein
MLRFIAGQLGAQRRTVICSCGGFVDEMLSVANNCTTANPAKIFFQNFVRAIMF